MATGRCAGNMDGIVGGLDDARDDDNNNDKMESASPAGEHPTAEEWIAMKVRQVKGMHRESSIS